MELSEFYDSFFMEAEELLADMERYLLDLDIDNPDSEELNAIFRAAHSIKGGAGAFGFSILQDTTHLLENLLDYARQGQLVLRRDMIDLFLESKDTLQAQVEAHRAGEEPDQESYEAISGKLKAMAIAEVEGEEAVAAAAPVSEKPAAAADATASAPAASAEKTQHTEAADEPLERIVRTLQQIACDELGIDPASLAPSSVEQPSVTDSQGSDSQQVLRIVFRRVKEADRKLLLEELGYLGEVQESAGDDNEFTVQLLSTEDSESIEAVMCFIIEADQVSIEVVDSGVAQQDDGKASKAEDNATAAQEAPAPAAPKAAKEATEQKASAGKKDQSQSSIRVSVDKVDQIINLVGELIIIQSMLDSSAEDLPDESQRALSNGLLQLQRTARDLQESVMSIRMLPMDFVFSRYPRQVRDLAAKLGKEVELVMVGKSTELDKGLIEKITDPLTHLVRNSLDHGIETPDIRAAAGKPTMGQLTLSARHAGGNIIIEVADDGAGLNREKLLAKASEKGIKYATDITDDEVWQLIFAPGFSTAEIVSDVSGRGVGMDVVKRNIQSLGGQVEIMSTPGKGTTTRVVLPLTLAILDGMSLRVGNEMFVLPLGAVSELIQPTEEDIFTMAGDETLLKVRDDYLPVVALRDVMSIADAKEIVTECIAVIVQDEDRSYALLVDEPVGQQQVVVKNLESNYRRVPGISAATILGDGRVALILDPVGLHRCEHARKKYQAGYKHATRGNDFLWEVTAS